MVVVLVWTTDRFEISARKSLAKTKEIRRAAAHFGLHPS
jgi:hypothetical protein